MVSHDNFMLCQNMDRLVSHKRKCMAGGEICKEWRLSSSWGNTAAGMPRQFVAKSLCSQWKCLCWNALNIHTGNKKTTPHGQETYIFLHTHQATQAQQRRNSFWHRAWNLLMRCTPTRGNWMSQWQSLLLKSLDAAVFWIKNQTLPLCTQPLIYNMYFLNVL